MAHTSCVFSASGTITAVSGPVEMHVILECQAHTGKRQTRTDLGRFFVDQKVKPCIQINVGELGPAGRGRVPPCLTPCPHTSGGPCACGTPSRLWGRV